MLHILADTLEHKSFGSGVPGLLFALGPGVSAEFVLLEWQEDVDGKKVEEVHEEIESKSKGWCCVM